VKKTYHIVNRDEKIATASIEQFAKSNGQLLLPLLELITQARVAVDEVISSIGRKTIETILTLSAEHVAGAQTPGKISGDIRWHGSQSGRVVLADRQLKVKRPRLRHKQEGEVKVPAYEALQENGATAQRMMGALLRGVSTRQYEEVLPEMAETAGVSRSSISRQAIEGSAEQLRQLRERRWDKADLLVIYIDGQRFGEHHVISGVGIDRAGSKHILGIEMGATENAAAVKNLLTGLRRMHDGLTGADHGAEIVELRSTLRRPLVLKHVARALAAADDEKISVVDGYAAEFIQLYAFG